MRRGLEDLPASAFDWRRATVTTIARRVSPKLARQDWGSNPDSSGPLSGPYRSCRMRLMCLHGGTR